LLYLSKISTALMRLYLNTAISFCRLTDTEPSFLLHPLDLISADEIPALRFFPGMDVPSDKKSHIFKQVIRKLEKSYQLVTMETHARTLLERSNLPQRVAPI